MLQQIGQQGFYAGGLQSGVGRDSAGGSQHSALTSAPGIIVGSATKEADYKETQQSEAEELVRKDGEGVQRNLEQEAEQIKSALGVKPLSREILKLGQSDSPQRNARAGQLADTTEQSAMVTSAQAQAVGSLGLSSAPFMFLKETIFQ